MPLQTVLRALRVLGCDIQPRPFMRGLRQKYSDLWAYADVLANLMCEENTEYSVIEEEVTQTFSLLVRMDADDTREMSRYLFRSCADRESIITAVIGQLRKREMADPTKTYSMDITFANASDSAAAPKTGNLMFRNGTWILTVHSDLRMSASGYGYVTERELATSCWKLTGWNQISESEACMQTDVTFGETEATLFFQTKDNAFLNYTKEQSCTITQSSAI
jgi:hypothetical protein